MAQSHNDRHRLLRPLAAGLALLALFAGSAGAAGSTPEAPDRTLRMMDYNIHHAEGADNKLDLQRIADIIRSEGADVVGLQEVDNHWGARSNFADQAAGLASSLNMHYCYGANLDLDPLESGQARRQYGTAVLSRFPILSCNNTLLPKTVATNEQRGLLTTVVNVRGVRVRVYNTHLQHNNADDRTVQVQAIKQQIGAQEGPVVLMGDLNAAPAASELAPLYGWLTDSWQTAGSSGDGYTYPVENPHARIDYIFVSGDVTVNRVAVATTPATAVGSDHLPVVADISLPGSAVGNGSGK